MVDIRFSAGTCGAANGTCGTADGTCGTADARVRLAVASSFPMSLIRDMGEWGMPADFPLVIHVGE